MSYCKAYIQLINSDTENENLGRKILFQFLLQELYFFFVILVVPAIIMGLSYCLIAFEVSRVVRQRTTMTGYAQGSRKST